MNQTKFSTLNPFLKLTFKFILISLALNTDLKYWYLTTDGCVIYYLI